MSSLTRKMQRKAGTYTPRPQYSKLQADGSILTLHPTRGFKRTCAARVAFRVEQARLAAFRIELAKLGHII